MSQSKSNDSDNKGEKSAWYLKVPASSVGESAVLVGDRSRVHMAATILENAQLLNEDRGLLTVTGEMNGVRITVSAFGMGAPIAAVVMHELADLGVKTFIRLGTTLAVGPSVLGDYILASEAVVNEGTSHSYGNSASLAFPSKELNQLIVHTASEMNREIKIGPVISSDGFYPEMIVTRLGTSFNVAGKIKTFEDRGLIGSDMETSALFSVGQSLGVEVASLCLATVKASDASKLGGKERVMQERMLLEIGLRALSQNERNSV